MLSFESSQFKGKLVAFPKERERERQRQRDRERERENSNSKTLILKDSCVKPVLNWANVCSPKTLRTVRRTMIHFLIELLLRRTGFGQFDEL